MVKIRIQDIDDDGNIVTDETLEGKTLYFILNKEIKRNGRKISFNGNAGFCGRKIPDILIGESWCRNIVTIIKNQCDGKDLETAFQLFNLSEMLEQESNNLVHEIIKTSEKGKLIPDEFIDFIRKCK